MTGHDGVDDELVPVDQSQVGQGQRDSSSSGATASWSQQPSMVTLIE